MKITINDKPLEEYLGQEQSKDIHQVRRTECRKYWKNSSKPKCRYAVSNGHSKVKKYEDWEIFVYLLDQHGLDITMIDADGLAFVWKHWKRWSTSNRLNKVLRGIVAIHPRTISDSVVLKELFYLAQLGS